MVIGLSSITFLSGVPELFICSAKIFLASFIIYSFLILFRSNQQDLQSNLNYITSMPTVQMKKRSRCPPFRKHRLNIYLFAAIFLAYAAGAATAAARAILVIPMDLPNSPYRIDNYSQNDNSRNKHYIRSFLRRKVRYDKQ